MSPGKPLLHGMHTGLHADYCSTEPLEVMVGAVTYRLSSIWIACIVSALLLAPAAKAAADTAPPKEPAKKAQSFDPRDLRGIWMQTRDRPFKSYPYNTEYTAILKQRQADEAAGKPFQVSQDRCLPAGLAASMTTGAYPIEIFYQKGNKEILIQKENLGAMFRVFLNRGH